MNYSVIFSTQTGNTAKLADTIKNALPKDTCIYFGAPDEKALQAQTIFIGFWTNKGTCDDICGSFLEKLHEKKLVLFGTAGMSGLGEANDYYERILSGVRQKIPVDNTVSATFMCTGKMPSGVRQRYEKILLETPADEKTKRLLANFHKASTHPDQSDLDQLQLIVKQVISSKP